MEQAPPADWYDDPDNAGILRFWDGEQWTERRKPQPVSSSSNDVAGGVFAGGVMLAAFAAVILSLVAVLWYRFG